LVASEWLSFTFVVGVSRAEWVVADSSSSLV
jgi:hypothetical protein